MSIIKKFLYILSWIPFFFIKLVLVLLGFILVPIALKFDKWPKLLWLWGNEEEGPPKWFKGSAFKWYAIRNPVNNTRFIFKDRKNVKIDTNIPDGNMEFQDLINNKMTSAYRWKYSGPFAGYRKTWIKNGLFNEVYLGWKVGSSVPGMGFTAQFRFNREE